MPSNVELTLSRSPAFSCVPFSGRNARPARAKAIGIPLKDLGLAEHCVIAAIIRDGVMTLPRGDSTLKENDEIVAVASPEGVTKLAELLAFPEYPMRSGKKKSE